MPLDTLITGRIATLAGDTGLRLGRGDRHPRRPHRLRRLRGLPRDARRPVHPAHPPRTGPGGDPRADRRAPPPRPGRHRRPARSTSTTAATLEEGLARLRAAHERLPRRRLAGGPRLGQRPMGRAGRPPTSSRPSRPGRRAAIWAHDHHALWASHAALRVGGRCPMGDPAGGVDPSRRPTGRRGRAVRGRDAARDDPRPAADARTTSSARSSRSARSSCRSASSPATTRAASPPIPTSSYSFPAYARLVGRRPAAAARPCLRPRRRASRRRSSAGTAAVPALGQRPDGRADGRLAEVLRRRLARVADRRAPRGHRARAGSAAPARPAPRRLDDRARRAPRVVAARPRLAGSRRPSTPSAMPRSAPRSTS